MASCDHDPLAEYELGGQPTVIIHNHADLCRLERVIGELIRHVSRLEHLIVTTREEALAALAEVKHDVQRLVGDLQSAKDALLAAIEAGNMDAIKAAADEIDTLVEAASPEPTEPPVEPTP